MPSGCGRSVTQDVLKRSCSLIWINLDHIFLQFLCPYIVEHLILPNMRGADKSLARLGMKQATATKLGIYSTYSPRSGIHSLACCSNFCKPLKKKKNSEVCPSNHVSASEEKWRPFNCFFQSREQVVVRRGQIRRIGWVIKTWEAQLGQFLLGCKCPVRQGIVVQEQDPLGDLPTALLL